MKFIIPLSYLLLMGSPIFAQTGINANSHGFEIFTRPGDLAERLNSFGITDAQYNSIKDGMYANTNFLYGNIFEDGKEMIKGLPMRYNAYADDIEVKLKTTDEAFQPLLKQENLAVKTLTDYYIYLPDNGIKEKSGYVNVLFDGKNYKLYKKITVSFKAAKKAETSYDTELPPSFQQTTYYYLVKEGNLIDMSGSKSKMTGIIEDAKPGIKNYIKKQKLDIRKEKDLIKVVEHLDTM